MDKPFILIILNEVQVPYFARGRGRQSGGERAQPGFLARAENRRVNLRVCGLDFYKILAQLDISPIL